MATHGTVANAQLHATGVGSTSTYTSQVAWTPSDAVILAADQFAAAPPLDRSVAARIRAEWRFASSALLGFAITFLFAFLLLGGVGDEQSRSPSAKWFGLASALGSLAFAGHYITSRRSVPLDALLERDDVIPVMQVAERILEDVLVEKALSVALLASEEAGDIRLESTAEGSDTPRVWVRTVERPSAWPKDSLEDRLRPAGDERLADLVSAWLAEDSYLPAHRAARLLQQGLVARGIGSSSRPEGTTRRGHVPVDPTVYALTETIRPLLTTLPVERAHALLDRCERERPSLAGALVAEIRRGLAARQREPREETDSDGATTLVYEYEEPSVANLDATSAEGATGISDVAPSPSKPGVKGLLIALLIWVAAGGASVYRGHSSSELGVSAPVLGAIAAILAMISQWKLWVQAKGWAQHQESNADPASLPLPEQQLSTYRLMLKQQRLDIAMSGVLSGIVVTGAAELGGAYGLALVALLVAFVYARHLVTPKRYAPADIARVVGARLMQLQQQSTPVTPPALARQAERRDAENDQTTREHIDVPRSSRVPVPIERVDSDDLDVRDASAIELLDRPLARRRALYRTHWVSAITLVAVGATVCVLASLLAPNPQGTSPLFTLGFCVAATVLFTAWTASKWSLRFDPTGNLSPRFPLVMTWVWRLLLVLLARELGTVGRAAMGVVIVGHFGALSVALHRIRTRFAVPAPLRLTVLRVFESASFADLSELIAPWRDVGVIEYLEGKDTIGFSPEAQRAMATGALDDLFAKSEADVRTHLRGASLVPDATLRFEQHSFQCSNDVWKAAIVDMLDRSDAVVMDLTKFSPRNKGSEWELGQLLDRVPLARVTLLVNDDTDMPLLEQLLANAARNIDRTSPNLHEARARWLMVRIGGLSARGDQESFFDWRRRLSKRLDPRQLTAHIIGTASPRRSEVPSFPSPPWYRRTWYRESFLALLLLLLYATALMAQPRTLKITSQVLGESKVVHIQLPRDYAIAKQRYPVVVLLDGQVRAFHDLTVAAADYDLTGELFPVGMPRQLVVSVEHGSRSADLGTNADAFLRFLTTELLPRVDRDYRTLPFRTLIGHSRGGAFALRAMCREAASFPAIIAISPSISDTLYNEVTRCVATDSSTNGARAQRHLVLSAGSLEPRALASTDRLLRALRSQLPRHWRVHQVDATGFEHTGTPLVTIPLGLRFVWDAGEWDLPQPWRDSLALRQGDPERVLETGLAAQSQRAGFTLQPSARLLSAVVRTWLSRGDAARSVASAKGLVARYPEEIIGYTLLADAYDLANDRANARKAIETALDMSGRVEWFDETQRGRFQAEMRRLLVERRP